MKAITLFIIFIIPFSTFSQDWWSKTREEAIPQDLKTSNLLVERFKKKKLNEAPPSAFYDKSNQEEHPLIKKTNNDLEDYNDELRSLFKNYAFEYTLCSQYKSQDYEKYPADQYPYALKHEVYMRKYQENGQIRHYYTYIFYFHDRVNKKDFPYIYLFEEERLKSLEKMIGYLNSL